MRSTRRARNAGQDKHVERHAANTRNVGGIPPRHDAHRHVRQTETDDGADACQHQAFGEELTQYSESVGAECRTHGHFSLTCFRARQQEVRHVCAGDQQQEGNGAKQQPDRAAHRADDFVLEREDDRVELHLNRIQTFIGHRLGDSMQLVGGLLHRRARLQTASGV